MSLITSLENIRDDLEDILQRCNNALFFKDSHVDSLSDLPDAIMGIHTNIKFTITQEYRNVNCGALMDSVQENITCTARAPVPAGIQQQYSGFNVGVSMGTLTESIITEGE